MAKKTTTDHATAAFWQLVEDDAVQQHLHTAAVRAREAWQRVARLRGPEVVEDKKLYDKVREAVTSFARALRLLGPDPDPPKKHRGRTLAGIALTAGAVAIVLKSRPNQTTAPSEPVPSAGREPAGAGSIRPTGGEDRDRTGKGDRVSQGARPQRAL
jgi:hypothetical protein